MVLTLKDKEEAKNLCGYVVSDEEVKVGELRRYLSKKLPDYMIPAYFTRIEKMPLTPNGKIDRNQLQKLDVKMETGVEYEPPRNAIEVKLIEIWKKTLKIDRIGINDNFFELGGHSLKATALSARIHKELKVGIPLREIFEKQSI